MRPLEAFTQDVRRFPQAESLDASRASRLSEVPLPHSERGRAKRRRTMRRKERAATPYGRTSCLPMASPQSWDSESGKAYSSIFRIFLSQFFLNDPKAPKNLSSVFVCSPLSYLMPVSSKVHNRSAAWAST